MAELSNDHAAEFSEKEGERKLTGAAVAVLWAGGLAWAFAVYTLLGWFGP